MVIKVLIYFYLDRVVIILPNSATESVPSRSFFISLFPSIIDLLQRQTFKKIQSMRFYQSYRKNCQLRKLSHRRLIVAQ